MHFIVWIEFCFDNSCADTLSYSIRRQFHPCYHTSYWKPPPPPYKQYAHFYWENFRIKCSKMLLTYKMHILYVNSILLHFIRKFSKWKYISINSQNDTNPRIAPSHCSATGCRLCKCNTIAIQNKNHVVRSAAYLDWHLRMWFLVFYLRLLMLDVQLYTFWERYIWQYSQQTARSWCVYYFISSWAAESLLEI